MIGRMRKRELREVGGLRRFAADSSLFLARLGGRGSKNEVRESEYSRERR
jgi:hypothetical protein